MTSPELWAPYVKIETPQVFLPFYVKEFVLHSEEGQHQWAQLTVSYHVAETMQPVLSELPSELWWPEDQPVRITYGPRRAIAATFVGYVVSPEIVSGGDSQNTPNMPGQMITIRYTLLGPTKTLQTVKNHTWSNCRAPYIAREISERNGLQAVTGGHDREFPARVQSESDFAFLRRIAAETGWRLFADGTSLYFTDPRAVLSRSVPVFRQNLTAGLQDTMQTFNAVTGDLDPAGAIRAEHESVSLSRAGVVTPALAAASRSSSTGQALDAQVRQQVTGYVAPSFSDAQAIAQAAVTRNLWWVNASATVDGDVALRPGTVVDLGGTAITAQYSGRWMTRSAHHRITISLTDRRLSTYYVDLTLGRDQADRLTTISPPNQPASQSVLAGRRWAARGVA